MERTQEQIIQDQVAERARYAASLAAASGNVAKDAFMNTVSSARSTGEKAVVFGALAGLVSFFPPWISFFGTVSASGLRAAFDASSVFRLHPLSMVVCFPTFASTKTADAGRRILATMVRRDRSALVGPGAVGFGGYLATASAGTILLGGVLRITERLDDLAQAA